MAGIETYIDIVNPYKFRETIEREVEVGNPTRVFINALILAFLSMMLAFAEFNLRNTTDIFSSSVSSRLSLFNPTGTPLDIIIVFCVAFFSAYLTPFVLNRIAKLLGGDGSFWKVAWPQTSISIVYNLVGLVTTIAFLISPCLTCMGVIIVLFAFVYMYYLDYKVIRAAHKSLSRNRAIITVIAGTILAEVIMVLVAIGLAYAGI